jgi:small conductance mechanosensitive channel
LLLLGPIITSLSSGVLPQVRGAFAADDVVRINGVLGTVHEIDSRTVVLDTSDGRRIYIPNSDVLNEAVENFTQLGRRRSSFDVMLDVGPRRGR